MQEHEIRPWCLALMETAGAAYLTTLDEAGYPRTRAMLNLRNRRQSGALAPLFEDHQEDFLLYFSTNTSSAKVAQIQANPHVSVYLCQPGQFHGLMLGGDIEIVADPALKRRLWRAGWEVYYPQGVDDPDYTVLRLLPAFARGWTGEGPFEFAIGTGK